MKPQLVKAITGDICLCDHRHSIESWLVQWGIVTSVFIPSFSLLPPCSRFSASSSPLLCLFLPPSALLLHSSALSLSSFLPFYCPFSGVFFLISALSIALAMVFFPSFLLLYCHRFCSSICIVSAPLSPLRLLFYCPDLLQLPSSVLVFACFFLKIFLLILS